MIFRQTASSMKYSFFFGLSAQLRTCSCASPSQSFRQSAQNLALHWAAPHVSAAQPSKSPKTCERDAACPISTG
jgi:hypothetical protein